MMVKVCGITRREDALAAAEAGATAIGFIFYPGSPRYVSPEQAAKAGDGLKVWKIGIFVDESPVTIEAVMRSAKLDVAQIYGGEAPAGTRVWRALRLPFPAGSTPPKWSNVEALLLDSKKSGESFDWEQAKEMTGYGGVRRIIIAGGLDADNVADAIRIARPWGVDASSKLETSPGVKDPAKLRAFVRTALDTAAALDNAAER